MRPRLLLPLAALAAALALPAAAPAAVTIGSNLAGSPVDNLPGSCNTLCTGTNLSLPATSTAANGLTSPINGVVVRWRVKAGSAGDSAALRVLRQGSGTTFTGAGSSAPGTLTAATTEFASRVAIRAGDSIGLNIANEKIVWANTPGATGVVWSNPGLAEGASASGLGQTSRELLVQAVVEADADGDGFGDETQDGCPGDPARQTPPCGMGAPNPTADPPPPVATAPVITGARVTPSRFRLDSPARIRFTLSKAASYRLAFDQVKPGRVRGTRCRPESRAIRTGRRCTAYVRRATRTGRAVAGANSLAFRGRIGKKALPLGKYRVTIGATDAQGNAGAPRNARFTLRPRLLRRR